MDDNQWLVDRFEAHRAHLRRVAYRMLGSESEADDAVQEAWIRLSRADTSAVENLGGWLTTVVARVSLDMLRSRSTRREEPASAPELHDNVVPLHERGDPEYEAVVADSVGPALLVVLETLAPAERLAFVLHDMFAVPFDEIGTILGRSPNAAKQLASRARAKVQGPRPATGADLARQREIVDAFLAASRTGDFEALLALLDPAVELRADATGVQLGSPERTVGARDVAATFSGRALAAQPALIDDGVGIVWAPGGRPKVVWEFTIRDGMVVAIEMIAAPDHLERLDLVLLDG